jgi:predicted RNA-binding Zn ribbon-like protein
LPSFADLLRFSTECGIIKPRQAQRISATASAAQAGKVLDAARRLRESAAVIFYALVDDATPDKDAIEKLDQLMHTAMANRALQWKPSRVELAWINNTDPSVPVWMLTQLTTDLLTSSDVKSLRACADPACRWLFLDTSRNHTRRWCDMKICGNRMKVRRFKAQHNS